MSVIVSKGNSFSGKYTQPVIATASDWTGSVVVYDKYPSGNEQFSVPIELSGDGAYIQFTLPAGNILNLSSGLYVLVGNLKSVLLNIDTYRLDYMTVTDAVVSEQPRTLLSMTIAKVDGTPAGKETRELVNNGTGTTIVLGWKGVTVTASHPIADEVTGTIIGTETISTETNAAGYAQLAVIKGQTVTVSCPSFGKTVTVDTTGHDSIDLSSYF